MNLFKTILIFMITISIWGADNSKIVSEETISLKNEVIRFSLMEGYFRTTAFYRNNFDLDSYYKEGEKTFGSSRHKPTIKEIKDKRIDLSTVSYNLRFRLSPSIQVGEYLKAITTFDIFDNTLWGTDSSLLKAKEGYLVAKSPFGLFKFGRMATNWGMGIFRNDGKGKFANFGTYVDQAYFEKEMPIAFLKHFKFAAAYEVNNSSISANNNINYDLEDSDDTTSYSLYLSDNMTGELLDEYLDLGKTRFNWSFIFNYTSRDMKTSYNLDTATNSYSTSFDIYPESYYTFDLASSLFVGNRFKLKTELMFKMGDYTAKDPEDDTKTKKECFKQLLFVAEDEYVVYQKTVGFGLDFGLSYSKDSQKNIDDPYNILNKNYDRGNLSFSRDYDIDLIFFKEISRENNVYFLKPHFKWRINQEFALDLWNVTTLALDKDKTFGKDLYLGTEFDLRIQYLNRDGLNFGIMTGLYLPGKGMDWLGKNKERDSKDTGKNADYAAHYATTIQAFMILKF